MKKYLSWLFSFAFLFSIIIYPVISSAQISGDVDPQETSISSCLDLKNNMRYRDRDINANNEVSPLQDFLQGKGYLNNEPTGYLGLLTVQAVAEFQKANNISPAVGYVGALTRAKIKSLSCGDVAVVTPTTPTTPTTPKIPETSPILSNSSCGALSNNLTLTDRDTNKNGEVTKLQNFLISQGYLKERATGYFGTVTTQAVADFQRANNISPAVGYVGALTRAKIKALNCTNYNTEISASKDNVVPISDNLKSNINLPAGCNSNVGFSRTTGQRCDGIVKVCPEGQTGVYPNCVNSFESPVTILSPNGGEVFKDGDQITVKWKTSNFLSNAKGTIILFSKEKNISYLIMDDVINDGIETFTITTLEEYGTLYKIRISFETLVEGSSLTKELFYDESDNLFTINSINRVCRTGVNTIDPKCFKDPNFFVDLKINGSDNPDPVFYDSKTTLSWTSSGAKTCIGSGNSLPGWDGEYIWGSEHVGGWSALQGVLDFKARDAHTDILNYINGIPNLKDGISRLKVGIECTDENGRVVFDELSLPIKPPQITNPSITLLSPNGGEVYSLDQQIPVKWSSTNISATEYLTIRLVQYDSNNNIVNNIAVRNSSGNSMVQNSGSTVISSLQNTGGWGGTFVPGNLYKIFITKCSNSTSSSCTADLVINDTSDNFFTINSINQICPTGTTGTYPNCITATVLNTPTLNKQLSTPSKTLVVGNNGLIDGSMLMFNFKTNGDSVTITDLEFKAGPYGGIISSVRVGQNSKQSNFYFNFNGLNLTVPSGATGLNLPVYISYTPIGVTGLPSQTYTSNLQLVSARYLAGNTQKIVYTNQDFPDVVTMTLIPDTVPFVLGASTDKNPNLCSLDANLMKGMKSPKVKCLQQKLNQKGYQVVGTEGGKETNEFGYYTMQALRKFQKDNNLTADGILGKNTRKLLNE